MQSSTAPTALFLQSLSAYAPARSAYCSALVDITVGMCSDDHPFFRWLAQFKAQRGAGVASWVRPSDRVVDVNIPVVMMGDLLLRAIYALAMGECVANECV